MKESKTSGGRYGEERERPKERFGITGALRIRKRSGADARQRAD